MGEQGEGSPTAAQSAQPPEAISEGGVFSRIRALFGGNPDHQVDTHSTANGTTAPGVPAIGMANLRRMRVEDVAIPKVEVVAVADDIGKAELVEVFRDSGLTRLPVYNGTLDTPIGFVHLKDFALKYGFNGQGGRFLLQPMVRKLIYAPPSMGIGVLLQKMQSERIHMALVIDEYGGVDGLVTIEDLIEQVIGEIEDEHDPEESDLWIEEKPGCYLAQARAPLDEFEAEIGHELIPDNESEEIGTLGGLVFVLTGSVPARGEVITHPSGIEIEVVDADPRRIKRLRVRLPAQAQG